MLRKCTRLDASIATERLRSAIVSAVLSVNAELAQWQSRHIAEGHSTLLDVPAVKVDGKSRLLQLYLRAVSCATAAECAERYRSYDATAAGNQRADDLSPTIDELRRESLGDGVLRAETFTNQCHALIRGFAEPVAFLN